MLTHAKPVKVPFHYETQSHQSTYNRPGNSGSQYTSISNYQNRPSAGNTLYGPGPFWDSTRDSRVSSLSNSDSGSGSTYNNNNDYRSKIYTSKFSTSNFNRLPPASQPEFDDYEDIDDGDENGVDSGEQVTNTGQGSPSYGQQQYYPGGGGGGYLGTFHKLKRKKKRGVICVPQGHGFGGGLFSGLFGNPFGGYGGYGGLGGLGNGLGLGFGSLFRSNEDGQQIESRQSYPRDDPRFLIKAPQFNFYGNGPYGNLYKPSSGYPCRPVDFYGQRPGFGQFGYFGDPGSGSNRPGIQSDTPVRPGGGAALGILSDAVKPVLESTAIQDGIGTTVSDIKDTFT